MKTALIRVMKWLLLLAIIAAVVLGRPWEHIPPEWHPWQPLSIEHPMTLVSKWKLSQLKDDPQQCLLVLETAPEGAIDYLALDDYTPVAGCPLSNVVRVRRSGVSFSSTFTITCPLAVAWVMFERQQLQPLAQQHMGSELTRIDHLGSFACRNIYHREGARRSQHATANAFDVAGFRFANGQQVSVLRHWNDEQAQDKSAFLKETHQAACRYFGTVLGPDYNQPHENHFHFDASGFGFCR